MQVCFESEGRNFLWVVNQQGGAQKLSRRAPDPGEDRPYNRW